MTLIDFTPAQTEPVIDRLPLLPTSPMRRRRVEQEARESVERALNRWYYGPGDETSLEVNEGEEEE